MNGALQETLQTSYNKRNFNQSSFDYYTSKCYEFENNVSQDFVVQKETRCRLIVSCENGVPFQLNSCTKTA